jgi:uncharacterized membrane protein
LLEDMSARTPSEQPQAVGAGVKRFFTQLRNILLAGLAVFIPVVVTIFVLNLAYRTIDGISSPILRPLGADFPGLGFVLTIAIIMLLGVMATNVLGRRILASVEGVMLRVPVFATIYGAVKQVMESIRKFNSGANFKGVVYVQYPSPGHRLVGFVTGQYRDARAGKDLTAVFLPTAPNPMTGFVLMVESEHLMESDLSLEEATKIILSAGLVGGRARAGEPGLVLPPDAVPAQMGSPIEGMGEDSGGGEFDGRQV